MDWFTVDRAGLAATLERRGKGFALFELVQNAWDSGAKRVDITLAAMPGEPYAELCVVDDSPEGWADMSDAFTMFGKSRRGGDAKKRGRFCMGEKLVLACCRRAIISTMHGQVRFEKDGRHQSNVCRPLGTEFYGEIRMTRDELHDIETADLCYLIPPDGVATTYNGTTLERPRLLATFEAKLPTETADAEGVLRRTVRTCTVEAFEGDIGQILEMGIPVCMADCPWRLNVGQKIPLGMERDSVTDAFRKALLVASMNQPALCGTISAEQAAQPWATEVLGDSRIVPEAVKQLVVQRFGDKAVVAVPGDPLANAAAAKAGCTVVHGGALSADAWANLRKYSTMPSTSAAFPQPTPEQRAKQEAAQSTCPACGQPV